MFEFEVILILMIIRVVLPVAPILWMDECAKPRKVQNWLGHRSR